MDIFEFIRTVDGFISTAILLYIYMDMRKQLSGLQAYLQQVLMWFLNRTDIPTKE